MKLTYTMEDLTTVTIEFTSKEISIEDLHLIEEITEEVGIPTEEFNKEEVLTIFN